MRRRHLAEISRIDVVGLLIGIESRVEGEIGVAKVALHNGVFVGE